MIDVLKEMFRSHEKRMATRYNINIKLCKMPANHINMGTLSLLRVQMALTMSMRKNIIIDSFKDCGIVVYGEASLTEILKMCTTKIDLIDFNYERER